MKTTVVIVGCLLAAAVFTGCAPGEVYKEGRSLELSKEGISVLEIIGGDGDIGIKGSDTAETIGVTADIEIAGDDTGKIRETLEKQLVFTLVKRGNRAVLESHFQSSFFILSLFLDRGRSIDLNIEVPSSLELSVTDNGGNLYISDMKNDIVIHDGDGSCVIENIRAKSVEIIDTSGPVMVTNVSGNIEINDKSEDIEISSCSGDIEIIDTTGAVLIDMCRGNLTIDDSTGAVSVEDHTGDVTLHARGRGDVSLQNVTGRVIQNY